MDILVGKVERAKGVGRLESVIGATLLLIDQSITLRVFPRLS